MLNKLGIVLLCLFVCGAQSPASAGKGGGVDACALVEASEVEAAQGGRVASARAAQVTRGRVAVAQCHYAVTAPDRPGQNLGVLLEVRSAGPAELAAEWDRLRGKKENKRSERPRAVEGVGEGAFWVGNDRLGALYVLGKQRLVYVSLGGPGGVGEKIEKSKRLALKALARL
jgi:hypothetical protein